MKENQHIEWKASWRDEYLKWICGFANAHGGTLFIGRDDDGNIVGVADAARLLKDIPNKVRDILGIIVDVNLTEKDGKELLEIIVEAYSYPVSYKGQYHYRSGATKQELKGAALDQFLLRKRGLHWDGVPLPHIEIADLDPIVLAEFRINATKSQRLSKEILDESDAGLVEKLHLTAGAYLKRAAVLLFHSDPERYVTGAFVKVGYFESGADLRYHDEIHGSLLNHADVTVEILKAKYLKALISYEGLQRIESYPMPEEALREALLNAVAHKDYSSGTPIQISVYSDKLMIWNPGQLPANWTVENLLQKHSSKPYNPDIANAFFRAGMIEAWGRGIERIMDACKTAKVPVPEIKYETGGLWVIFHYPDEHKSSQGTGATTRETTQEKLGKKLGERLGKNRQAIIDEIQSDQKVTVKELALALGISETAIENNIKWLKENGYIDRIGSRKGGHWKVLK